MKNLQYIMRVHQKSNRVCEFKVKKMDKLLNKY